MLKSLYIIESIVIGIFIGIVIPIFIIGYLINKPTKHLLGLILIFALFVLFIQFTIAFTGSMIIGIILYLIPWIIISVLNDFSIFDENKENKKN